MYDIHLVGTGINMRHHLTAEGRRVLQEARRVYHVTAFHEELCGLNRDVVNWYELYASKDETTIYSDMASLLLDEGAREPGVACADYGHPLVMVSTFTEVLRRAPERGLKVNVVPGISSIDVLLTTLRFDMAEAGLLVIEANRLLTNRVVLSPYVDHFITQVGDFGSRVIGRARRNHPHRFVRLQEYLLRTHSPDHPITLLFAPFKEGIPEYRYDLKLGELADYHDRIFIAMTMYIPALPPVRDEVFFHSLNHPVQVFCDD